MAAPAKRQSPETAAHPIHPIIHTTTLLVYVAPLQPSAVKSNKKRDMPCTPCSFCSDDPSTNTQKHTACSAVCTTSILALLPPLTTPTSHTTLSPLLAQWCISPSSQDARIALPPTERTTTITSERAAAAAAGQEDHDSLGGIGSGCGCDDAGDERRSCVHPVPSLASALHGPHVQGVVSEETNLCSGVGRLENFT